MFAEALAARLSPVTQVYENRHPQPVYCAGRPLFKTPEGRVFRRPCGEYLSPMIDNIPRDEQEHHLQCPKCGNVVSVFKTRI